MTDSIYLYGPSFSTFVRTAMMCCEEKSIPYQVGSKPFGQRIDFFSDAHTELHPEKLFPALIHNQLTLSETAPICRYLDDVFPGIALQPTDPKEKALVDQWCQIISIYAYKAIALDFLLERVFPKGPEGTIREARIAERKPNLEKQLQQLTDQLGDDEFLCNNALSLADLFIYPLLDSTEQMPDGKAMIAAHPTLADYLSRLQSRPSALSIREQQSKPG